MAHLRPKYGVEGQEGQEPTPDPEKGRELISEMVRELACIDLMLEPIMPETSGRIIAAIVANKKPANLFPRKE